MTKPYFECSDGHIYHGNALEVLKNLLAESVHMCVTSPPYWGLRDYGVEGQLGLEKTPEEYIQNMVQVFREVWRVLRGDGTLFLNMGDSYTSGNRTHRRDPDSKNIPALQNFDRLENPPSLKPKDLIGIPWRLALALQADGWYLRSAMPWVKRSAMPESCKDRPASALEYMFLFSKSAKYYFDMDAIRKEHSPATNERSKYRWQRTQNGGGSSDSMKGYDYGNQDHGNMSISSEGRNYRNTDLFYQSIKPPHGAIFCGDELVGLDVNPKSQKAAHFATFAPKLIEPCILAGCPVGGTVLDPFFGSGTTGIVSYKHDRKFVGIELSQTYLDDIAIPRIKKETQQLKLF